MQPLAGVGVVVVWGDHVLLVQRGQPPMQGFWSVPGGLIELGETTRQAAVREVIEETGLEIELGPVLTSVDRIEAAPDGRVRYHFVIVDFLAHPRAASATTPPPLIPSTDAAQARWVFFADLSQFPLTEGLEPVLRLALRR